MTSDLVYKVALVLGSVMLFTVCGNFAILQAFGLGGSVLTASGMILVGMSVWRKIDVSVSEKGFSAKLERIEAEVRDAKEHAIQSEEKAQQATDAVVKLKHSLQVQSAQSVLSQLGFKIFADGLLGPQTRQALKQFQAQKGLPETGELDKTTATALQVPPLG